MGLHGLETSQELDLTASSTWARIQWVYMDPNLVDLKASNKDWIIGLGGG